ncbi:MAG TPA: efflux transporter outer membrane subunit [Verrucomicrobiae bacterium]|jgi:NodT family efflux transporter outer membrane factor (OMF) lipoprotein|nr:efflux transporter outer membrane subunit [Verrucomicrobiae bacterium]
MRTTFFSLASLTLALLGGCAVGPNFHPPKTDAPSAWTGVTTNLSTNAATAAVSAPAQVAQWWENFHDPLLTSLVRQALVTNLDWQIAVARLRQARAERGIAAAAWFPSATASASYERAGFGASGRSHDGFLAGLDAIWELDIFGGTRRNVESANALIEAAGENIHDVQVSVAAEVALNYIQLRSAQEQVVIAQQNLEAQRRTADLTRRRLAAGFVSALDVANANAQVATTESAIPGLDTLAQQSIYALSVLLNRWPADLLPELSVVAAAPLTPPEVPVGLPSELARRRPDIRAAEAQLHSATAQIGVAEADLFPKFSLTGSINYQNDLLRTWFAGAGRAWQVGPSLTWPILQGGSIVANVHLQQALRDEFSLNYRKTVLTAFQEVENALVAFGREWDHRKALTEAAAENRRAVDLSMQLYTQGATDFLSVLDAQRSLYISETALAQSRQSISTDLVSLYKALGGGWE